MSKKATKHKLRSAEWFGRNDRDAFVHRSWMKNQGFPHDLFDGRPVIGICRMAEWDGLGRKGRLRPRNGEGGSGTAWPTSGRDARGTGGRGGRKAGGKG